MNIDAKERPGHGHDNDHDGKDVTIIVNSREKTVPKGLISFAQLVALAFNPVPTGENIVFTITYRKGHGGHGDKPEGTLSEGESVKVKDGMVFNVRATDKS